MKTAEDQMYINDSKQSNFALFPAHPRAAWQDDELKLDIAK